MASKIHLASNGGSIATGDTDVITIDSSNNVGIGTTSPDCQLHVKQSAWQAEKDGEQGIKIENSHGNKWNLFHNNNSDLLFVYNGLYKGYLLDTSNVQQIDFTGQHRSLLNNNITESSVGLIVSTNGTYINTDNTLNPTINESLPICDLSNMDNDKKVFGVISDKEDIGDNREYASGSFVSVIEKRNQNEQRMYINSVGEGAMWVCNKNGTIENGDYITSTNVTGYGGKQTLNEGILMNSTVAKITCDCVFSLTKIVKQKLKIRTITETLQREVYEEITESKEKPEINFDATLNRYVQTIVTEDVTNKQIAKDTHDLYDSEGNIIGTHEVDRMESYDKTTTEIDYDANGDVQYEDDLDENGDQQMVYPLETRFLQADGTQLTDEADYTTRLGNGESVYIACFVGCTYHCG